MRSIAQLDFFKNAHRRYYAPVEIFYPLSLAILYVHIPLKDLTVKQARWLGFSSFSLILVLAPVLLAMGAFSSYLGQAQWLTYMTDAYTWRVVWFSWWQASLSTIISLSAAVLVARALARRQSFVGRWLLLRCFSVCLLYTSPSPRD